MFDKIIYAQARAPPVPAFGPSLSAPGKATCRGFKSELIAPFSRSLASKRLQPVTVNDGNG
jgi:hypothetical protein